MVCATRGGDGWLWYALGASLLLGGGTGGRLAVAASSLAAAAGIVVFLTLKKVTRRRRPREFEAHCWATLLPPDQFSFPSGHTITAFAVVVPVMLALPQLSTGLLICALSVAASRILLGMHFLTDVLVGIGLGALLGLFAFHLLA
jgi:undecaprenyl-diphosphatase